MRRLVTWLVCALLCLNVPLGASQQLASALASYQATAHACDCPDVDKPCDGDRACSADPACAVRCSALAAIAIDTAVMGAWTSSPVTAPMDAVAPPQSEVGLPFRPPKSLSVLTPFAGG